MHHTLWNDVVLRIDGVQATRLSRRTIGVDSRIHNTLTLNPGAGPRHFADLL